LVKELFHRRNRTVHFGEIGFQQPEAEICLILATSVSEILKAMDAHRRRALEAKHATELQGGPGNTGTVTL